MDTPFHLDPIRLMQEIGSFQRKLGAGMGQLRGMREPGYANTPRELVYAEDKLKLWHMRGDRAPTARTPRRAAATAPRTLTHGSIPHGCRRRRAGREP